MQGLKLGVFSTAPAIRNVVWNNITEIIGTFVLVFGVWAIFAGDVAPAFGPFLVASLVWGIGFPLVVPRVMRSTQPVILARVLRMRFCQFAGKGGSDWGYSWIPVVGPIIGGYSCRPIDLSFLDG